MALVRERLSDALNEVDRGVPVVIERRGVRYRLTREAQPIAKTTRKPVIERADADILAGDWSWNWSDGGLQIAPRARR